MSVAPHARPRSTRGSRAARGLGGLALSALLAAPVARAQSTSVVPRAARSPATQGRISSTVPFRPTLIVRRVVVPDVGRLPVGAAQETLAAHGLGAYLSGGVKGSVQYVIGQQPRAGQVVLANSVDTLRLGVPLQPDLAVAGMRAIGAPPTEVEIRVTNLGNALARPARLATRLGENPLRLDTIPPLVPRADAVIVVPLPAGLKPGDYPVNAVIIRAAKTQDANPGNDHGSLTVTIPQPPPPKLTRVPGLVGRTRAQAAARLKTAALRLGRVDPTNANGPRYLVVSQAPDSGVPAPTGSGVNLWLRLASAPAESVAVPDLRGLSVTGARRVLDDFGLALEPPDRGGWPGFVATGVVGQAPNPGIRVPPGSPVSITLAPGWRELSPWAAGIAVFFTGAGLMASRTLRWLRPPRWVVVTASPGPVAARMMSPSASGLGVEIELLRGVVAAALRPPDAAGSGVVEPR